MIDRLLDLVLRRRYVVVAVFALVAAYGLWNLTRLNIDAVPDITNKQVQINTVAPSLGPQEIEKRVSQQVEIALAGIPGLSGTRSLSRNGFSQVTAVFDEDVDLYFARQQVAERLAQSRDTLPAEADPRMGAVTTGLGEVLSWSVTFDRKRRSPPGEPGFQADGSYLTLDGERLTGSEAQDGYLRTVQDWIIAPQLKTVAGVAGVDSIGGYEKAYVVEPNPTRLAAYGISYAELVDALKAANLSAGADYVRKGGEAFLVRADARVRTRDDIEAAIIADRGGVAVAVRDVGAVQVGSALRSGAGSRDGREAVIGTVQMLAGANSRVVARDAANKLSGIAKSLPPGVRVEVVYDRSRLVRATIATVARNLGEGALFVVVVLFVLLGNIRAALITTLVIPLAMLMTAIGMNRLGVSANLMSLGALDFGLIVDGAVIVVENCLRRLAEHQHATGRVQTLPERLEEVREAAHEMIRPALFGQAIILLVYAPLLTFQGVEGKLFTPMAVTVMLALAAALILSLTLVPALVALFVDGQLEERDVPAIAWARRKYAGPLDYALREPKRVVMVAVGLFAVAALMFSLLGREFTPKLDEQDIALEIRRVPSMSLEQGLALQLEVERAIRVMPEVQTVFSKLGTAEAATDPVPMGSGDAFVILKPRADWPDPDLAKQELIERIEKRLDPLIGTSAEVTQPIEMRFNELIAGVRSDVAVKVFGEDLGQLSAAARQVANSLSRISGASGVRVSQTSGFPTFEVAFDRQAIARSGLTVQEVVDVVAVALGGRSSGVVLQGDQQFEVVVRAPAAARADISAIAALPVMLPAREGQPRPSIPLSSLAQFRYTEGLNQVDRQNGQRLVIVQANVRGRDLGSFVAEAQRTVEKSVRLPAGAHIAWSGQFDNLRSAQRRLLVVVPACFALILGLLGLALGSWRTAALVFSAVPLAWAGGIFTLAARGMPFSISAAVGFIALAGIAVLNGLVMLGSINKHLAAGLGLEEALSRGAMERLRPILMTALLASLGFVPMAIATGAGAEVQKPLATVVIGGLLTATALTLLVLPALVRLFGLVRAAGTTSVASMP